MTTLNGRPAKRAKWRIDLCVSLSPLRGFRSVRTLDRGLTSTARRCRRCAAGSTGRSDSTGTAWRPHRPSAAASPKIAVSKRNKIGIETRIQFSGSHPNPLPHTLLRSTVVRDGQASGATTCGGEGTSDRPFSPRQYMGLHDRRSVANSPHQEASA